MTGRRQRVLPALLVLLALVAAACSAGDDDTGGPQATGSGDTTAPAADDEIDPEGVLRAGYDLETQLTNLDPSISNNTCDRNIWTYVLDSLLHVDESGNLAPGIAQEWSVDSPTQITLTLRPDLTYHDGEALTADTVRQGIDYNNENTNLEALDNIAGMEAVDETTLRITLEEPTPLELLYAFTGQDGMLVAPSAFGSASDKPVGAGPFVFESYEPGSRLVMSKFDDYYDADDYLLGGLEYVQTASVGPGAITPFEAGDVDLIKFLAESVPAVEAIDAAETTSTATNEYIQLEFRLENSATGEKTPFADKLVRQAISTAINREEINAVVENGSGVVTNQPYPPGNPFHVAEVEDMYAYDPEAARQLLADAGYPEGFEFDMAIPGGNLTSQERQAELIQAQLVEIGVKVNIVRILPQDIANDYYLAKQGDAFSAHELPSTFPAGVFHSNFGNFQFVAIHDGAERDDITELAQQSFASTSQDELVDLVRQMGRISVENALDVPIANTSWFAAWNSDQVGGAPTAPSDACTPWGLKGVFVKA